MFRAEEDYIKIIYTLTIESKKELASTSQLAQGLKHSTQTIIEMLKKLEVKNLVEYTPYKGVRLTEKGKDEALRIIRAHRIWEVFLTKRLGFSWDEVHEEAELLEHASSERIIDRLYSYLNEPLFCQHGNPIPDKMGIIKEVSLVSLDNFNYPGKFIIERFFDEKDVVDFLKQNDLKIGSIITINSLDLDNNLLLSNHNTIKIDKKIASSIFGQRLNEVTT